MRIVFGILAFETRTTESLIQIANFGSEHWIFNNHITNTISHVTSFPVIMTVFGYCILFKYMIVIFNNIFINCLGSAFASSLIGGLSTSVAVFCHELPHELG